MILEKTKTNGWMLKMMKITNDLRVMFYLHQMLIKSSKHYIRSKKKIVKHENYIIIMYYCFYE